MHGPDTTVTADVPALDHEVMRTGVDLHAVGVPGVHLDPADPAGAAGARVDRVHAARGRVDRHLDEVEVDGLLVARALEGLVDQYDLVSRGLALLGPAAEYGRRDYQRADENDEQEGTGGKRVEDGPPHH